MAWLILTLVLFWLGQAGLALMFQFGSTNPGRWLRGYVIGNVIGVSSAVFWMLLLNMADANVATGLAIGGGFLTQQIAIVLVYRGRLNLVQMAGIAAIVAGMLCLGVGARS